MSDFTSDGPNALLELNQRSRDVFRQLVETYLETGGPVGSRTLSKTGLVNGASLSPASIRNVMADLEDLGLLSSPHTSAGRMPTEAGLRLFVDALLQVGDLSDDERAGIEAQMTGSNQAVDDALAQVSQTLSGLSQCAGLVVAPKREARLKQLEFVPVAPGQTLAVIVFEDGLVENRIIDTPVDMPASSLTMASNYLNARLKGRSFGDAQRQVRQEISARKAELDALTAQVVEAGLAVWSGTDSVTGTAERSLIVRGRGNLLEDVQALDDLERVRKLFDDLETKEELLELLTMAEDADGVRIFIGSETKLFSLSGSSVIVSPYTNADNEIVGVLGVVGPTRLNYARVIPMVDYTARLVTQLVS
ncbi:heat-inducible transcriptional repressor HrcA [Pyruvatibacter sp. HU-CL02332]|uniref:heat-inducible transcriptional repressor HrcA n=1 Tax=Pyruvatibacter sp. HU-CL02332 TaxID=3127650 RepID=UPI003106DC48